MKKIVLMVLSVAVLFSAPIEFSKTDICLIRNLHVYKDPSWVAKITTRQHKSAYFSSPKSMFEYYYNPIKWPSLGALESTDIEDVWVSDFNTLEAIDAKTSYFVYGSNKTSPGGDDLVAFKTKSDAKLFASKHNGKRVLSFYEVKNSLIQLLNGSI